MTKYIPIKESYRFSCTMCAHCCTGDQEVLLTPFDLYKMGRFLHYETSEELFDNGWAELVKNENNVWRPQIRFKIKPFKYCPFLSNELDEDSTLIGRCQLHPEHKPLVCAMAPVGRIVDMEKNTEEYVFVKPAPDCPGVHSAQQNSLNELLTSLKEELDFQRNYFELLEIAKNRLLSKEQSFERLYQFRLNKPFRVIIADLKKRMIR